jgi:hypothetical protein
MAWDGYFPPTAEHCFMAYSREIERFDVKTDNGDVCTVVKRREFVGPKGEEVLGMDSYNTLAGKPVEWDPENPDIFLLPFGVASPWIKSRRI